MAVFITAEVINTIVTHRSLIDHFQSSLPSATQTLSAPPRQSHVITPTSALLMMPSWSHHPSLPYIGVKLVTHFPQNSSLRLPGVHAAYALFSSTTGHPLAFLDGTHLTLIRTSSASALAARLLSKPDPAVLSMLGAGALAPHLIRAHLAARPSLRRVVIWNRSAEKAASLAEEMGRNDDVAAGVRFESCESVEEAVRAGDVVSCATNSEAPLVEGRWLKPGAHLDLVGSFKPSMRECDDEALRRGRVFVDNDVALVEAGELVGAFERGVIQEKDVCGNLVELLKGEKIGRKNSEDITVFKSVGSSVVDILAAQLIYETYIKQNC